MAVYSPHRRCRKTTLGWRSPGLVVSVVVVCGWWGGCGLPGSQCNRQHLHRRLRRSPCDKGHSHRSSRIIFFHCQAVSTAGMPILLKAQPPHPSWFAQTASRTTVVSRLTSPRTVSCSITRTAPTLSLQLVLWHPLLSCGAHLHLYFVHRPHSGYLPFLRLQRRGMAHKRAHTREGPLATCWIGAFARGGEPVLRDTCRGGQHKVRRAGTGPGGSGGTSAAAHHCSSA